MDNENITLIAYNSKKQASIYLIATIMIFGIGIACIFFAEGSKKFASIGAILIGVGFLYGYFSLLKSPEIAFKIVNDQYIYLYDVDEETCIHIDEIQKVLYWPTSMGIKFIFITSDKRYSMSYLVKDRKKIKKQFLTFIENHNIKIVKRYSRH